jgi:hypothetical protein
MELSLFSGLERDARLDAEISIEFPTWSEARGGV